jgi:hypothetical protein
MDPPPIIEGAPAPGKLYQPGDMACLSVVPSWDAPIVVFEGKVRVDENGNFRVDGTNENVTTEAKIIWPTWNENIDYTAMVRPLPKPSGTKTFQPAVWLVWHDGELWYPTIWYSIQNIGEPPNEAMADTFSSPGWHGLEKYHSQFDTNNPKVQPQPVINRGSPIRVWLKVPEAFEEFSLSWYQDQMYDWSTGFFNRFTLYPLKNRRDMADRPMTVIPFHTVPIIQEEINTRRETNYFPSPRFSFFDPKVESSKSSDALGNFENQYFVEDRIKTYPNGNNQASQYEEQGWSPYDGTFPRNGAVGTSPYFLDINFTEGEFVSYGKLSEYLANNQDIQRWYGNFAGIFFGTSGNVGYSANLWQKKAVYTIVGQKLTNTGPAFSAQFYRYTSSTEITSAAPPADKMFLVHPNPLPGFYGLRSLETYYGQFNYFKGSVVEFQSEVQSSPPYNQVPPTVNNTTNTTSSYYQTKAVPQVYHPAFLTRSCTQPLAETIDTTSFYSTPANYATFLNLGGSMLNFGWKNNFNFAQPFYYAYVGLIFGPLIDADKPRQLDPKKTAGQLTMSDYSYGYSSYSNTGYGSGSTLTRFKYMFYGDPSFD